MRHPMIKLILILVCCVTLGNPCQGQTDFKPGSISLNVKWITLKLKKYDKVTGARVGKGAFKSDQYKLYEKLKRKASENELYELTNHKSPVVRAYALTGLAEMNSPKTLDVLMKNQNDTTAIDQQFGCIGAHTTVIGYMLMFIKSYVRDQHAELSPVQEDLIRKLVDDHHAWAERKRKIPLSEEDY